MAKVDNEGGKPGLLEVNRGRAVELLGTRLATGDYGGLRKYQTPVLNKWLGHLQQGETAGYMLLPTGAGKTMVAAKFAELGLPTIVTSPTGVILDKTKATLEAHAEGISVTNFDGRLKDLSGNVINTTRPSLEMLAGIPAVAEGVGLVIVDENHFDTLGAKRYQVWRQFPNALFVGLTATDDFSQLDELERRGLVDPSERWTGMFRHRIHELTRKEAQAHGALTPLDIHIVHTTSVVGDVHISKGEYDPREIDRMLNTEARNVQVLALVAGLERIPPSIRIPGDKRAELQEIHEKIKDKKTAIFGLSINHIEALAQRLRDLDVRAVAVHGKLSHTDRDAILKLYDAGRIQVLLGVDLLSLGWDSPSTEVGIFMRPRRQDTTVIQEVGRLLRPSEDTGKVRAIAVQLVDQYEGDTDPPVLIPEVVDPDYILQGRRTINLSINGKKTDTQDDVERESTVTVSGINIETYRKLVSEVQIRKQIEAANSLEEIDEVIDMVTSMAHKRNQGGSVMDFYRDVASLLSRRVSQEKQKMVVEGTKDSSKDRREMAEKVLIFLNLKSIFTVLEPQFSHNEELNEDILHSALLQLHEHIGEFNSEISLPMQLNVFLKQAGVTGITAEHAHVPTEWVQSRDVGKIYEIVDSAILQRRALSNLPLNIAEVEDVVAEVADETGYDKESIREFVVFRDSREPHREDAALPDITGNEGVNSQSPSLDEDIASVLGTLSEREQIVVESRYGLQERDSGKTLDEIGREVGVTRERIRANERDALVKLRHPSRSRKLRDHLS